MYSLFVHFWSSFLALSQKLVRRLEFVRPSKIKLEFGRSVVSIGLTTWILDTNISGFHMSPEFGPPESECSLYIKGLRDEHAQVLVSKTYSEWKHPFYNIRCLWLTSLFGKTRLGWDKFPDRSTWPYLGVKKTFFDSGLAHQVLITQMLKVSLNSWNYLNVRGCS